MNLINEVDKPMVKKTIVVYAGRFQPFHKGHYAAYSKLVSKFGSDNVYIGTSNDQSGDKSPFNFREKKEIATKMFGIPSSKFVQIKNPYKPVEILSKYDGQTTAYIAAVGDKDATRLQGKYFKPYKNKTGYGYDEIGYVYPVPAEQNPISGTDVRNGLGSGDEEKAKKFFLKAYPKFNKDIYKLITGKLVKENFPGGVGVGLTMPNGYINGAPKKSDVDKLSKTIHKKDDTETNKDYVYDPISEIIDRFLAEEIFNEFIENYLGEAPNAALDKDITYTNTKGKQKKIKARDALRLPKDHPAHIQASKLVGSDKTAAMAKGPSDAPVNQPNKKPDLTIPGKQPGSVVKKSNGKPDVTLPTDKSKSADGPPPPPPAQKLSGVELKSDAEKSSQEKSKGWVQKKLEAVKQKIKDIVKDFTTEEQHDVHHASDPHSEMRKSWTERGKNFIKELPKNIAKAAYGVVKQKYHQFKNTGRGLQSLAISVSRGEKPKFGYFKNKEGKWQHSKEEAKRQKKACISTVVDAAVITASIATGGAISGAASHIMGGGALHGIGHAAAHGVGHSFHAVGTFAHHAAVDFAKHCGFESVGLAAGQSHGAAYGTAAGAGLGHVAMQSFGLAEGKDDIKAHSDMFIKLIADMVKRMETFKPNEEQLLATIESYKKQKEENHFKNLTKGLNENIYNKKNESIQNFVEWASSRLKLSETPKITLFTGNDYSNGQSSLGGYNPESKEIFVQIEGRLTADILRTIAHEMVHRKQDEMGLIGDPISAGKDGSNVENSAHAVAGILMREYGRNNKEIFQEGVIKEMGSRDIHLKNILTKYRDSSFRKRINAYLFRTPHGNKANDVAKALRNMDYHEVTKMEKDLNLHNPDLDETIKKVGDKYIVYPKNGGDRLGTHDSLASAKKQLAAIEINKEDISVDVNTGDTVLMGKFKNKKVDVKSIGKDNHGMPTINGKQATTFRTINEDLLMEGGAYGHMSHPFDDMDLTFGQLKDIISKALDGELGVVREKTDGQALAISWKNGRLIAARNKGHLANAGANAMGIEGVASKFAGRGGLTDAYNFAMKDLNAAISGLSQKQKEKIFNEGKCFMNLEVIWPESVNVIPYGQALLIFHNTTCYNEKGDAVAADQSAARILAGMIKQVNADVQSKYTIQGPPVTEIPKNQKLSAKKGGWLGKLSKLQSEFGCSDSDTMAVYHQHWWENFIDKNAPVSVDKLTKEALIRRWAFGDKSFRLNTISDQSLQDWAVKSDKVDVLKKQKENMKKFEEIFLGVGADVLEFVGSVLTVHPDKAIRSMKDRLKQVASQVKSSTDVGKIMKFKSELERLNSLGGIDRIVASEGLVFFYNGKTYKLTGTFAPLNQLLGIFYE